MHGRSLAVTMLICLASSARVDAHRLEASYKVRPGQQLQVEAWFDLTGQPAREARVQVLGPGDQVVFDGRLDEKGIAVIDYPRAEPLRVIVSAGAGHVKELHVESAELEQGMNGPRDEGPTKPLLNHSTQVSVWNVLLGVGILAAIAAVAMVRSRSRERRAPKA